MKTYREMIAGQKGIDLVSSVYKVKRYFPKEEQFGITNHIQKSFDLYSR
jgi:hypothetical protein